MTPQQQARRYVAEMRCAFERVASRKARASVDWRRMTPVIIQLVDRVAYGGRKGRSARRRLGQILGGA